MSAPPQSQSELLEEKAREHEVQLEESQASAETLEKEKQYATGLTLNLIVLGLTLSVLLVALDNAILATAIPTITTAFNSLADVGWYGSAFLITICALQPISGKLYQHFSLKWTYLAFLFFFELGSLICGIARSSNMLIGGRAVAGMGAAGLFSGALNIVSHSIPLRLRPVYIGVIASMMQIANVLGPLIGGALTQHASWRWCFFINLPAGAVTALLLVLFFHPDKRDTDTSDVLSKISYLDLPGFVMFIPTVIMLLLAVQWGGNEFAWNSATTIGLLCGFVGMAAMFSFWQWRQQDEASIPPKIFLNRNIYTASTISFFMMGCLETASYYLPIWFQVIKGASPQQSGIDILPVVLSSGLFTFVAGGLVTQLGYYNPWLFMGSAVISIGGGVLTLLQVDSGMSKWIGYQVILGFGAGASMPMALIAVMAVLPQDEISIGNGIVVFFQFLGGAIFLAISESLFTSKLLTALATYAPQVDAQAVVAAGAAGVRHVVGANDLPDVLEAYNVAILVCFYLVAAGGAAAFVASFGMQWISVKGKNMMGAA